MNVWRYKYIIIALLNIAGIVHTIPAFGQFKHDYNWVTGFWVNTGYGSNTFDFNGDTLLTRVDSIPFAFRRMNSCISDTKGNLLIYFNGCHLANGIHEIIENGGGFNAGLSGDRDCPENYGYSGGFQSALTIPSPGKNDLFWLFYTRTDYTPKGLESSLLYSEINMDYNNGFGIVNFKDRHVLLDSVVTSGRLTAAKHINNEDWWLLTARRYTNQYARILITSEGLIEYPDISIGGDSIQPGGQTAFSPDGTRYMRYTPKELMVMDFDRSTGLLSNYRSVAVTPEGVFTGGTFSPNGRFVYISNYTKLYQVDTWDHDLKLELVAEWDGTRWELFRLLFGSMQAGPDCRIYIATTNCTPYVHIIMNPDEKGPACNVVQRAIVLNSSICGFPHFPNFRLGTPYPYCDPDKVVVTSTHYPDTYDMVEPQIFPNPVTQDFTIRTSEIIEGIDVFDIHGHRVFQQKPWLNEIKVSVQDWSSGVYFVHIRYKGSQGHLVRKIVVMP